MGLIGSFRQKHERYPVLRFVAAACSLLGVVLMALGMVLFGFGVTLIYQADGLPWNGVGLIPFAIWASGLFLGGVQALALGSFYRLAIHVEENTRAKAQTLELLRADREPRVVLNPPPLFPS